MPPHLKPNYQPVKDFTFYPVLCSSNNKNMIQCSHKATSSEDLDKFHQVIIDDINNNIPVWVKNGQYGAIDTTDTTTMVYYVIKLLSDAYKLQEYTTCDGLISTAANLVVKSQHMNFIQDNKSGIRKNHNKKTILLLQHIQLYIHEYI